MWLDLLWMPVFQGRRWFPLKLSLDPTDLTNFCPISLLGKTVEKVVSLQYQRTSREGNYPFQPTFRPFCSAEMALVQLGMISFGMDRDCAFILVFC